MFCKKDKAEDCEPAPQGKTERGFSVMKAPADGFSPRF